MTDERVILERKIKADTDLKEAIYKEIEDYRLRISDPQIKLSGIKYLSKELRLKEGEFNSVVARLKDYQNRLDAVNKAQAIANLNKVTK